MAAARSRFAAACGALSQYVKAAESERMHARPPAPLRPLPLMPGADVDASPADLDLPQAAPAPAPTQLTIVYGGRVLVLADVPADKAAGLLRLAASAAAERAETLTETEATGAKRRDHVSGSAGADLPVARKASLQRFMEKRKARVAAARTEPYRRPDVSDSCPDNLKLAL